MPSEIEIYSDIVLFGIRVAFQSDNETLMETARALCGGNDGADDGHRAVAPCVYVVLRTYGVNHAIPDCHNLEGSQLLIRRGGAMLQADGAAGRGVCDIPRGTDEGAASEMIHTLVLFLVAQAGRTPLHASAIMLGDTAVVLAGRSGSGKSSLALAADRAGLAVLSDDTIYVQTDPSLRLWSLGGPIHLLAQDTHPDGSMGHRLRGGKLKKIFPVAIPRRFADRAILCLLSRGDRVALAPRDKADAVRALTKVCEPGFEVYGGRTIAAIEAVACGGTWSLTLSSDPVEAIALLRDNSFSSHAI